MSCQWFLRPAVPAAETLGEVCKRSRPGFDAVQKNEPAGELQIGPPVPEVVRHT